MWRSAGVQSCGDSQLALRLCTQLADDPDDQVRSMAAAHHEAIHELQKLLDSALHPRNATSTYDTLISPVLVALACASDRAR